MRSSFFFLEALPGDVSVDGGVVFFVQEGGVEDFPDGGSAGVGYVEVEYGAVRVFVAVDKGVYEGRWMVAEGSVG